MHDMEQPLHEFKVKQLDRELIEIIIPECCREGWKTCTHVVKREPVRKPNVGL